MYAIATILGLLFLAFIIYWMLQILAITKQNRIINSMILKTMLQAYKSKGVDINIEKIQQEVEDSL